MTQFSAWLRDFKGGAIDQPYNLADAVLSAMHGWIDRLDQTLYDVIPPGDWGIVLEGDDA